MGSTWFCDCGGCDNTYIDLDRIDDIEGHISWIRFQTGNDHGRRFAFDVPVVHLAMMFDLPEQEQYIESATDYGWFVLDCYGGDFDLETPDGYTSLLIDEEFIKMLKEEVYATAR